MSRELFVTNFISGKAEGSQKMRWWLRHGCATSLYLQKWDSRRKVDGKMMLERDMIKASVEKSCVDWNGIACRSQKTALMTEHAALELGLADAALSSDPDMSEIKAISDFMVENVEKQVRYHEFQIPNFPSNRYRELLLNHVKLFTESIRWLVTPDDRKYASCEERRMENILALAAFSTEWF